MVTDFQVFLKILIESSGVKVFGSYNVSDKVTQYQNFKFLENPISIWMTFHSWRKHMQSEDKFALLIIGLPIAGLLYSGLGIALMVNSSTVRHYPLISGGIFVLIPFLTAVFLWTRASAKAYKK